MYQRRPTSSLASLDRVLASVGRIARAAVHTRGRHCYQLSYDSHQRRRDSHRPGLEYHQTTAQFALPLSHESHIRATRDSMPPSLGPVWVCLVQNANSLAAVAVTGARKQLDEAIKAVVNVRIRSEGSTQERGGVIMTRRTLRETLLRDPVERSCSRWCLSHPDFGTIWSRTKHGD